MVLHQFSNIINPCMKTLPVQLKTVPVQSAKNSAHHRENLIHRNILVFSYTDVYLYLK